MVHPNRAPERLQAPLPNPNPNPNWLPPKGFKCPFTLGAVVFLGILYADNTWYLLNVVVQTTGYYLQWVMQVGFDCDAFQQLGFEVGGQGTNYMWGSDGSTSAPAKLAAVGFKDAMASTPDCGTPNPCKTGFISLALARALYEGAKSTATTAEVAAHDAAARVLQTYRMSETSVATTGELFGKMKEVYGGGYNVPCGSGFKNDTHFISGAWKDHELCDTALIGAAEETQCNALWAPQRVGEADVPPLPRDPHQRDRGVGQLLPGALLPQVGSARARQVGPAERGRSRRVIACGCPERADRRERLQALCRGASARANAGAAVRLERLHASE